MCLLTRLVGTLLRLFLLCYETVMGRIDASIPSADQHRDLVERGLDQLSRLLLPMHNFSVC